MSMEPRDEVALLNQMLSEAQEHAAALERKIADAWEQGYNARCDDENGDPANPAQNPYRTSRSKRSKRLSHIFSSGEKPDRTPGRDRQTEEAELQFGRIEGAQRSFRRRGRDPIKNPFGIVDGRLGHAPGGDRPGAALRLRFCRRGAAGGFDLFFEILGVDHFGLQS